MGKLFTCYGTKVTIYLSKTPAVHCCLPKQLRTVFKIFSTTAGIRQAEPMPCAGYPQDPAAYPPRHSSLLEGSVNGLPTSMEELCSIFCHDKLLWRSKVTVQLRQIMQRIAVALLQKKIPARTKNERKWVKLRRIKRKRDSAVFSLLPWHHNGPCLYSGRAVCKTIKD